MSGIDIKINQSENIDLSGEDIYRITGNQCNIISYDDLQKINSIDEILGSHNAVAILYTTKDNYGHWVSLMKNDNELEFFDPYGYSVDEELKVIEQLHLRKDGKHISPHLTALINQSKYTIKINKNKVQKFINHTNTCGRWVALRIKFRNKSLSTFINYMCNNKYYDGDFWVSALTILN